MTPVRPDLLVWIQSMPVVRLLGLEIVRLTPGGSTVRLAVRRELTYDGWNVQGGIVGLLADVAGVSAGAASLPEGWGATTASYSVSNIAPARGEALEAQGTCVSSGRRLLTSTVQLFALAGLERHLCAVATTTAVPLPPPSE